MDWRFAGSRLAGFPEFGGVRLGVAAVHDRGIV
jgi:hypothetical protein